MSMDNYRTEVTIPVTRDSRTFEQQRKDMLNNLERSYSRHVKTDQSKVISETDYPSSVITSRMDDPWDDEVNRWIRDARSRWNEDTKRMRNSMFTLEPVDDFDSDQWAIDDPNKIMEQMERRMESLRQQMGSMSGFGSSPFSGSKGGSTMQTSSSRITSSSTTTTSGSDPHNTIRKSNVVESSHQSRTINGETTSRSSHSASSNVSTGADRIKSASPAAPGALLPQSNLQLNSSDFLKDAYELGDDGKVHFKVRFDATDFAPEDIEVTTVDNRLNVHAKKSSKTTGSANSREFSQTIELPRSIDYQNLKCHLTTDGVLMVDAPINAPDYQSITFDKDNQIAIRPRSSATLNSAPNQAPVPLTVTGRTGPTIMKEGLNGRKLHLEVVVDPIYRAEELSVRREGNRIIVSGIHKAESNGATSEFTQSFEIPETVDPLSITAQLIGTNLVIEVPLLCTV